MSLSKDSLAKVIFAALGIAAAAGVYGELASMPGTTGAPAVEVARRTAATAGTAERPSPLRRSEPSAYTAPATDPVEPATPRVEVSAPSVRRPASGKRAARPVEEASDAAPAEDPVATAASAFAARLEGEPFDARWSKEAESRLADHFAALSGDRALPEVRCRTTVCRVELAFESEAARDDGLGSLSLPWDSVAVYQVDESDPRNVILYATRQPEDVLPRG
jgi:hypothetical protein